MTDQGKPREFWIDISESFDVVLIDGSRPGVVARGCVESDPATFTDPNDYLKVIEHTAYAQAQEEIAELKAKLDVAVQALEFYANRGNWTMNGYDGCPGIISTDDLCDFDENGVPYFVYDLNDERPGGKTARATLKELGVE